MDAPALGRLDCLAGAVDVLLAGARKPADNGILGALGDLVDGRKIAFTSRRDGRMQIYVVDLDGGNVRQLTTEGSNDLADWSRSVPQTASS